MKKFDLFWNISFIFERIAFKINSFVYFSTIISFFTCIYNKINVLSQKRKKFDFFYIFPLFSNGLRSKSFLLSIFARESHFRRLFIIKITYSVKKGKNSIFLKYLFIFDRIAFKIISLVYFRTIISFSTFIYH